MTSLRYGDAGARAALAVMVPCDSPTIAQSLRACWPACVQWSRLGESDGVECWYGLASTPEARGDAFIECAPEVLKVCVCVSVCLCVCVFVCVTSDGVCLYVRVHVRALLWWLIDNEWFLSIVFGGLHGACVFVLAP
jgi:hypothetical protein